MREQLSSQQTVYGSQNAVAHEGGTAIVHNHQYSTTVNEHLPRLAPAPHQLPFHNQELFTGRRDLLDEVLSLFKQASEMQGPTIIWAVAGMAGVGKSTLAIHTAHHLQEHFPDAQLYVDLQGQDADSTPLSPLDVLARFLRALGDDDRYMSADLQERASRYRSLLANAYKRTLVLLDNAHDAAQVYPLLPSNPGCAVLITSRRRLDGLDGAVVKALDVMEPGEALELLERLIGESRARSDSEAGKRIVRLCGYLPLALRIAGGNLSRKQHRTLAEYADQLSDEQHLLDQLRLPDPNREVRASFEVSYRDLTQPQAHLFGLLGRLPGADFGEAEVGCLLGGEDGTLGCDAAEAQAAVDELVDHYLVEAIGANRYRFHDLVRVFAREKLGEFEDSEAQDDAWDRVVMWYVHAAKVMSESLRPESPEDIWMPEGQTCVVLKEGQTLFLRGLEWFDIHQTNLKAALASLYKDDRWEDVWRLAANLVAFFDIRALWVDWEWSHELALEATRRDGDRGAEAAILINLGNLRMVQRQRDDAVQYYEQSLAIYRDARDRSGEATALNNLGNVYADEGRCDDALRCYEEQLAIRRELDGNSVLDRTSVNIANIHMQQGHWAEAAAIYEDRLRTTRELGDQFGEAIILSNWGVLYDKQGHHAEAMEVYEEGLRITRQLGDRHHESILLAHIGHVHAQQGHFDDALRHFDQELALCRDLGDRRTEAQALLSLAQVHRQLKQWDVAVSLYRNTLNLMSDMGDEYGTAQVLVEFGLCWSAQEIWDRAVQCYKQSLAIYQTHGERLAEGQIIGLLGDAHAEQRHWGNAIDLYNDRLVIMRETGDHVEEGHTLMRLGVMYGAQDQFEEAIGAYEASLHIKRETTDRHGEGEVIANLGVIYNKQERWDKAIAMFEDSRRIMQELGDRHGELLTLVNLSVVYGNQGHWDRAIAVCEEGVRLMQEEGDRYGEGQALLRLSRIHDQLGETGKAAALKTKASSKLRPIRRRKLAHCGEGNV